MDNLVLVGFSCSGKTTIGRMVARRLQLEFVDTDHLIEEMSGKSVSAIFVDEGEDGFRVREREAIERVCAQSSRVISTGGGAFMDEQNREWLKQGNLVIHLRIRAETVVERLMNRQGGRERPLLKAPDPLRRVQELMAEREPAYAKAQVSIDTEGRGSQDVVAHITRQWLTWRRSRAPANPAAHATSAAG